MTFQKDRDCYFLVKEHVHSNHQKKGPRGNGRWTVRPPPPDGQGLQWLFAKETTNAPKEMDVYTGEFRTTPS